MCLIWHLAIDYRLQFNELKKQLNTSSDEMSEDERGRTVEDDGRF